MPFFLTDIAAAGYRSLRAIRFPVGRLTVFIGANGAGKTNLYRTLQLIQTAAAGTLSRELAAEGGMESALWAGKRRRDEPARIVLAARFGTTPASPPEYGYEVAGGLAAAGTKRYTGEAAFHGEPLIREETLTAWHRGRPAKLLERRGPSVMARDSDGARVSLDHELMGSETALGAFEDPARFPAVHLLRATMLDWRFYHEMRTDRAAPLRHPCLAVASPTLASDGSNLAAVFATLAHIREDTADLDQAVADAFPGATIEIPEPHGTASLGMVFPDYPQRIFQAAELSDGTLRYLALAGALIAYRLPAFIALNEPETSLHPICSNPWPASSCALPNAPRSGS
jgi:predicted ATPase